MQIKSLESKGYSESIVSGKLHQGSDLEYIKCKLCYFPILVLPIL